MRTTGRNSLKCIAILMVLTAAACGESPPPSTPALRLVQTGLRREFNTRFITVSERPPDTLLIAARAGRLVRGASGGLNVSSRERVLMARRALALLAPNPADRPAHLKWIVVEISDTRRFGPLVFGRGAERSIIQVNSLFPTRGDSSNANIGELGGSLRSVVSSDSAR